MNELSALSWSKEFGGTTIFGYLDVGDEFSFPRDDAVQIKTSRQGYRLRDGGRTWRAGQRTAVRRIETRRENSDE